MSITNELREYATVSWDPWPEARDRLFQMCDRIDAEHESACAEAYGNGVMSVPIALDESAWVKLPVDADGVPIHVGDVMEFSAFEIEKPVTRMVDGIGQGVFFAWCGERGYQQYEAKRYRHHHAPTVEDVLREFAERWHNAKRGERTFDYDALVADYAKRLTLAEGEDA